MRRFLIYLTALAATTLPSSQAWAGKYDLDLTPLGTGGPGGGKDNAAFRSLSSELGTVMAPKPVDPADSLGLSGFAVAFDMSINTIGNDKDYWTRTADGPNKVAPTMQLYGRKGLWPGVEIGAGATHLFDSNIWALGGYGKIALHEGFHHLPIPTIAVRFAGSQLLGAKDIKMSMLTPGVEISHVFGLGKTFNLTPYVGYEALLIIARSTVVDGTPNCDEFPDDYNQDQCAGNADSAEFVFKKQDVIVRHRPYLGARFIFSVLRFTVEAMFTPPGRSKATIDEVTGSQEVSDGSTFQQQYTFSVGFDF